MMTRIPLVVAIQTLSLTERVGSVLLLKRPGAALTARGLATTLGA
jgi:hypothetical protein